MTVIIKNINCCQFNPVNGVEKYINVPEFLIQNLNLLNDKCKKINILILKPKNVTELEMY